MNYLRIIGFYFLIFILSSFNIISGKNENILGSSNVIEEAKTIIDSIPYKVISKGNASGVYQAVPDACRLKNGDIVAVFYAGDDHVTFPGRNYPKAGKICLVRSDDEGRTWSKPVVIYDDIDDNRDPHITQLSDGSLICSFFSLKFDIQDSLILTNKESSYTKDQVARFGNNPDLLKEQKPLKTKTKAVQDGSSAKKWTGLGPYLIKSFDNGKTWEKNAKRVPTSTPDWYCSAKVREMPDGTCLLPVYYSEVSGHAAWGGVVPSNDKGKTWGKEVPIGDEANLVLAAETDVILLTDKTLYASLRGDGSKVNMHYATSKDLGKTWSAVCDIGFVGHSPSFTRLKTGEILLSYRAYSYKSGYYTGLRISRDEARSWEGPYLVDKKVGGYPSTIEMKDGSILIIYYEEGVGSAIRALRFKMPVNSNGEQFAEPKQVEILNLN